MSQVKVIVDKRVELIGIILELSDYLKLQPFHFNSEANKNYNKKIKEYFSDFKNHPIIEQTNFLIENLDFNFSAPYELALTQFDENLNYMGGDYDLQYKKIVDSKQ